MLQIVEEWNDKMYGVFDTETNEMRMCHKTQLIVMREKQGIPIVGLSKARNGKYVVQLQNKVAEEELKKYIEEGLLFLTKIKKIYYDSLSIEIYVECNLGEKSIYVSLNKKNELVYKDSIYRGREKKVGKKELELLSKRLSGLTIVFNRNRVGRDDFFKCIIPIKRELVKNGKYQMKWIVGSIDYLERYPNLKEMNKGYYSYEDIRKRIVEK